MESRHRFSLAVALLSGVGVLEALLLRMTGPPSGQLQVLARLNGPSAEPLEGLLAALSLTAQALAAYLVCALALRAVTYLPGLPGQLADRVEQALTIPPIRRGLDVLLGGALIAQLALTPAPAATGIGDVRAPAVVATGSIRAESGPPPGLTRSAIAPEHGRATTVALSPPPPPVPLPIWLGGHLIVGQPTRRSGPVEAVTGGGSADAVARAAPPVPLTARPDDPAPAGTADDSSRPHTSATARHIVEPGDTLWSIALAQLSSGARAEATMAAYWRQIYGANRDAVGPDPNLIHPGVTLAIPPYAPFASPPSHRSAPRSTASPWPRSGSRVEQPPDRLP